MKINLLFCVITMLLWSSMGLSQSTFDNIRTGRVIKNDLYLDISSPDKINYTWDGKANVKTLDTLDYFQVKDKELRIYHNFLNPLKYRVSFSNKKLDDEITLAAITLLETMATSLSQTSGLDVAAFALPAGNNNCKMEMQLNELYLLSQTVDTTFFLTNSSLKTAMCNLNFSERSKNLKETITGEFTKLNKISSLEEIGDIETSQQNLIGNINREFALIDASFDILENEITAAEFNDNVILKTLYLDKYAVLKSKKEDLRKKVTTLTDNYKLILKQFLKIKENPDNKAGMVFLGKLDFNDVKKRNETTLKVSEVKFDENDYSVTVKKTQEFKIHSRKYTIFIPIVSSGIVYTNVSFPQYGTDTDADGNTIITRTEDEENEFTVGAYLNLYLNNTWETPVFLQLGLGPSKEKPFLFLGGGMSIYERIALSAGAVFTWYPELNDLALGQVVGGTSIIEKDISYSFNTDPQFYIGISFNISK